MFPFIIHSGSVVIPAFFFFIMLGILGTTFFLYLRAPKLGYSQVACLDFGIVGGIFGILGARLFHVLFEALWFYREDPWRFFEFWRGGFVSYGAFIGGAAAILIYLKIRKLKILDYADFVTTAIPIMIIAIRIGCLGAGCCYGKPTDFFLYLTFSHPSSDAGSKFPDVHLHATQIYNMMNGIFLLIFLNWKFKRRKFHGQIFLLFFILYPIIRGMVEFLRGDEDRGVYASGSISTAQIVALIIVPVASALYLYLAKRSSSPALPDAS